MEINSELKFKSKYDYFGIFVVLLLDGYISYSLFDAAHSFSIIFLNIFFFVFSVKYLLRVISFFDSFLEIKYPIFS